jgi:hypothetical protein
MSEALGGGRQQELPGAAVVEFLQWQKIMQLEVVDHGQRTIVKYEPAAFVSDGDEGMAHPQFDDRRDDAHVVGRKANLVQGHILDDRELLAVADAGPEGSQRRGPGARNWAGRCSTRRWRNWRRD